MSGKAKGDSRYQSVPRSLRERVLERDGHECRFCGLSNEAHREKYGHGIEAHHIVPQRIGGRDHVHNLVAVCKSCHGTLEELHARAVVELDKKDKDEPIEAVSTVFNISRTIIPKDIRHALGVADGDRLHWQTAGDGEMHVWVERAEGSD